MSAKHRMLWITSCLGFMLAACGAVTKSGKVARGSQRSADSMDKAAVTLEVSSDLKDGAFTNLGKHEMTVKLSGNATLNSASPSFVGSLKVRVRVTSPTGVSLPVENDQGAVVEGGLQDGPATKWTILLDEKGGSAEGLYKIAVEIVAPGVVDKSIIDMPKTWEAGVTLDVTPPVVGVRATLASSIDSGARTLDVHAFMTGEKKGDCRSAELRTSVNGSSLPLSLTEGVDAAFAASASIPADSIVFSLTGQVIADSLKDPFTVYVKCSDQAGNASEFLLPVNGSSAPFLFTAVAEGTVGSLPSGQGTAVYVKPGILKVDLGLVDAKSGAKASELFTSRQQSLLRATVTDSPVASLAELQAIKSPIWSQVFTTVMSVPLSSGYDGQKSLYVSLVFHDVNTNTDQWLGTIPLTIFVVTAPPKVAWSGKPQFVPYSPGAAISGQFIVTMAQAPLANKDPMLLDYSVDGATWVPLAATFTKLTSAGTPYQFSASYPLATESSFRLRVRITDLAGNVTTSAVSANIIGKASLSGLTVPAAERSGKGGLADFKPWLASSILCRKVDGLGAQNGPYYAQLLVQNRGAATMAYYSSGAVNAGMGYQMIFSDTVANLFGRFEPPTDLTLGTTDVGLFTFAISEDWLAAAKITVRFGLESTGATSLTNQYAPSGIAYQDVVIQDRAAGLTLSKGPFSCDSPQLIAP